MARQSSLNLNDDRKMQIIVSLMSSVREHISEWHGRSYTVTTWSTGILLGITSYWLSRGGSGILERTLFGVGTVLFGTVGQIYLHYSHIALKENGRVLVRCEAALRLTETGTYFADEPFFPPSPSGEWLPARDIITLRYFHAVAGLVAVGSILFFK